MMFKQCFRLPGSFPLSNPCSPPLLCQLPRAPLKCSVRSSWSRASCQKVLRRCRTTHWETGPASQADPLPRHCAAEPPITEKGWTLNTRKLGRLTSSHLICLRVTHLSQRVDYFSNTTGVPANKNLQSRPCLDGLHYMKTISEYDFARLSQPPKVLRVVYVWSREYINRNKYTRANKQRIQLVYLVCLMLEINKHKVSNSSHEGFKKCL